MPSLFSQKNDAIIGYAAQHGCDTLVETGAGEGDMIAATLGSFEKIYSIELSHDACLAVANRFRNAANVTILHGDSGEVLGKVIPLLTGPTLFYLDAHYCGGSSARGPKETPVLRELEVIIPNLSRGDVILIDDWTQFGSNPEYPKPAELIAFITSLDKRLTFETISNGGGMAVIQTSKRYKARVRVTEVKVPADLPIIYASKKSRMTKPQKSESVGYMAPSSTGGSGQNRNQTHQTNQSGKKV